MIVCVCAVRAFGAACAIPIASRSSDICGMRRNWYFIFFFRTDVHRAHTSFQRERNTECAQRQREVENKIGEGSKTRMEETKLWSRSPVDGRENWKFRVETEKNGQRANSSDSTSTKPERNEQSVILTMQKNKMA